ARTPGGEGAQGISVLGVLNQLTVDLPSGATAAVVSGSVPATATSIRFRENYYIPLNNRVENAVGALFSASQPGDYVLQAPNRLDPDTGVVFKFAFGVSFLELSTIKVEDIEVAPDPAQPIFETEEVPFRITGDPTAEYRLRFVPNAPTPLGTLNGLRITVPVL